MWLSFESGIVRPVFDTERWPLPEQVVCRCLQMGEVASVLDEKLRVIARCYRTAMDMYFTTEEGSAKSTQQVSDGGAN